MTLGLLGVHIWKCFVLETPPTNESVLRAVGVSTQQSATQLNSIYTKTDAATELDDDDCLKHSKFLLSQPSLLHYPRKHYIDCQVEMFERPILLKGKPTFASSFEEIPSEFTANALDIYDRHNNAKAQSYVSVYDAVESALMRLCQNLRRAGLDKQPLKQSFL
jgi:hypothetical protein